MRENVPEPGGEFLLYQTEDGRTRVECRFADESLWLSQASMAELFQTSKQNIAKHLKAIFAEGELAENSVVNSWLTTATDGKRYRVAKKNAATTTTLIRGGSHNRIKFHGLYTFKVYLSEGFITSKRA